MVTLFSRTYWHTNNSFPPVSRSALMNIFKTSVSTVKIIGSTERFLEAPKTVSFLLQKVVMQLLEMAAAKLICTFGFHQCSRF